MKKLIFLLFCLLVYKTQAQQNFFNVPSTELTEKKKLFFQQQLNVSSETESNTTLTYGILHRLEGGININNVNLYHQKETSQTKMIQKTTTLINLQYLVLQQKKVSLSLGTQSGFIPFTHESCLYMYANSKYTTANSRCKFVLGSYYANKGYSGYSNQFGMQMGTDIELLAHSIYLTADCMTGKNNLSLFIGGLTYHLNDHVFLSAGGQLPFPASHNDKGVVVELTIL